MKRYNIYEIDLSLKRSKINVEKMKKRGKKNGNVLTREEIIARNRKHSKNYEKVLENRSKEYIEKFSRKMSEVNFNTTIGKIDNSRRIFLKKNLIVKKKRERDFCGVMICNEKKVNKTGVVIG